MADRHVHPVKLATPMDSAKTKRLLPRELPPASILACFCDHAARRPDQAALLRRRNGRTESLTWGRIARDVARAAGLLRQIGTEPGDRVAQWSENRYEWIVFDLAIQAIGAVHVPLHATLAPEQAAEQIERSGAKVLLVSRAQLVEAMAAANGRLPDVAAIVAYEPLPAASNRAIVRFDVDADLQDGTIDWRVEAAWPTGADLATILFTSGTTGAPRGVMLTHGNLVANARAAAAARDDRPNDLMLNFLPLSHIFARTCDLYIWLVTGSTLALAENRETVLADCAAVGPTVISGVPYFFDKLHRTLTTGNEPPVGALQKRLGGRIRVCHCGGAPLAHRVFDFFWRQRVPLLPGYGLTESSPVVSVSDAQSVRPDAVGRPIAGAEVRIAPDGEILTRGPHVMAGYWQDEAATGDTIRDGWLHTGDLGLIDDDGLLQITGRKKELIVLATGKKVSPASIEARLTDDPAIEQAIVIGEGRHYLAALIVPDRSAFHSWATDGEVRDAITRRIGQLQSSLAPHEQIRRFHLLTEPLTIENGLLSAKRSLRRAESNRRFAAEIQQLYE